MPRRRRKTNRAEVERAYSREELKAHIKRLGLHSEAEYQKWCKNRGLGGGLYKSKHQKRKERHLASVSPGEAVLSRARGQTRNRGNTLRQLYDKSLSKGRLGADYLYRVRAAFSRLESDPPARRAYLELLLAIEPHERLFGLEPALPHLGATPENTWMDGLSRLARLHERWVRPLKDWRPDTHNARRQFAHLARYLLARYNEVPDFLDAAWFFGDDDVARRRQGWFLHLGGGGNLRTAPDLPVQLTKRMAHVFLQGESHRTPEQALRWAQVKGQGGSQSLAEAILQTRIAQTFEHEDFWASVITFFVRNPMLDPVHVGPIVDFLHNQKFVRAERLLPGGEVELDDPPQPNLSMKSRSIDKLLRQVEEWHEPAHRRDRGATSGAPLCLEPAPPAAGMDRRRDRGLRAQGRQRLGAGQSPVVEPRVAQQPGAGCRGEGDEPLRVVLRQVLPQRWQVDLVARRPHRQQPAQAGPDHRRRSLRPSRHGGPWPLQRAARVGQEPQGRHRQGLRPPDVPSPNGDGPLDTARAVDTGGLIWRLRLCVAAGGLEHTRRPWGCACLHSDENSDSIALLSRGLAIVRHGLLRSEQAAAREPHEESLQCPAIASS